MSLQTINFAGIAPIGSVAKRDVFGDILRGYQIAKEPEAMERKRIHEEQRNSLGQLELEHEPERLERKKVGEEFGNTIKGADAKYAERMNEASLRDKLASAFYKSEIMGRGRRGAAGEQVAQNGIPANAKERRILWNALGPDAKRDAYAFGAGIDMTPQEVQQAFLEGKDLRQIAHQKGIELEGVEKQHLPTTSNVTRQKEQDAAGAELDVMEKIANKGLTKYSQTFKGYSLPQMIDALRGENEEEQADFLVGRALQPEIAGIRTRIAGGSNAQEALNHMQEASLGNIEIMRPLVTPAVFEKMQMKLNEALNHGLTARRNSMYNQKKSKGERFKEHLEKKPIDMISDEELNNM